MAFEPKTWTCGETITADELNRMEQGIANAGVLMVTESNLTLDKTWQEIHDAVFSVLVRSDEQFLQMACSEDDGNYLVAYWTFGLAYPIVYKAESASGYPVVEQRD